jgi:hypothetical protein
MAIDRISTTHRGSPTSPGTPKCPDGKYSELMATLYGRYCGYFEASPLGARICATFLRPISRWAASFAINHTMTATGSSISKGSSTVGISAVRKWRRFPGEGFRRMYTAIRLCARYPYRQRGRIDGEYKSGLPPGSLGPLKALSLAEYNKWMLEIAQPYITPQLTSAHP